MDDQPPQYQPGASTPRALLGAVEAQELHELLGAALETARNGETGDVAELERAREIAALLVSDLDSLPQAPPVAVMPSTLKLIVGQLLAQLLETPHDVSAFDALERVADCWDEYEQRVGTSE